MVPTFPEISISTERLELRPFDDVDRPALVDMMNDDLIRAWTSVPIPYTEADASAWLGRTAPRERAEGRGIVFAVAETITDRLVGVVHLMNTDWRCRTSEVSYAMAPWARGEGYAAESVLALAQWLFHAMGFERLELRTAAGNTASQQVAQKIGCISEGVLRSAWVVRSLEAEGLGAPARTDLIVWSLLPEDLEGGTQLSVAVGQGSARSDHSWF